MIGVCLVDNEDMQVYPHLRPWLACLYVKPEHRRMGHAMRLLRHVVSRYDLLHMWTFNQRLADYYKQVGFQQREIIEQHGAHANIYYMVYQQRDICN
jgi:ribosomal protein S18 acetylase RimI-like enzyme